MGLVQLICGFDDLFYTLFGFLDSCTEEQMATLIYCDVMQVKIFTEWSFHPLRCFQCVLKFQTSILKLIEIIILFFRENYQLYPPS
jgi:hypothetical protein